MARLVHSMIRVLEEARSLDFYRRAFRLEIAERVAFNDFTLIYLRTPESDFELELTVNAGRAEPFALGDGYGHLALVVEDLAAEHTRMHAEGLDPGPLRELQHEGRPFATFFFIADPDGYRIEVLQKGGRFG
jgi:lactoylglutathione lyase